jgi:hypothetical protein
MRNPTPEVENILEQTIEELLRHDYRRDRLSQGLFLLATDLNEHLKTESGESEFERLYRETRRNQPDWVIDELDRADLPLGFAESAADGDVELIPFDDPQVDHEWLMYPGNDFFEVIVRQYYPVICGKNSLQALANQTRTDKNLVRDGALLLMGGIGAGGLPWVPLCALIALHIIEENVDRVCEEYEPY